MQAGDNGHGPEGKMAGEAHRTSDEGDCSADVRQGIKRTAKDKTINLW